MIQATSKQNLDVNSSGAVVSTPVGRSITGTVQAEQSTGTFSTAVITVVVSNDPAGVLFRNHPSAVSLTGPGITQPFNVSGYLYWGMKVTTVQGAAGTADVYFVGKDQSP